jgi:hypothetical protein
MDAEQCRRQAAHYVTCANQMTDPSDKAAFRTLAAYWVRMAEQAQRTESGQTS